MKLSIVTLSKNRTSYLKRCLSSISEQNIPKSLYINVIISIGSINEIDEEWIKNCFNKSQIKYKLVIIEGNFTRSNARNQGIKYANGDYILFLDCDVVLGKNFIYNLAKMHIEKLPDIIIPYLYGYKINLDSYLAKYLLDHKGLFTKQELEDNIDFIDLRENLYNICQDNLKLLSVPWTNAWGTALLVKYQKVIDINGFDEDYKTWGSEDTDFALRLKESGCDFQLCRDLFAVHMPHQLAQDARKSFNNRILLHKKHYTVDTELLTISQGYLLEQNKMIIESSFIGMSQCYNKDIVEINRLLDHTTHSLCVGLFERKEMQLFHFTDYFAATEVQFLQCKKWTQSIVHYLLGVNTFFCEDYFDIYFLFDSYRKLPESLMMHIRKELERISKKVVYYDDRYFHCPTRKVHQKYT